jgi:hypothetical protein
MKYERTNKIIITVLLFYEYDTIDHSTNTLVVHTPVNNIIVFSKKAVMRNVTTEFNLHHPYQVRDSSMHHDKQLLPE